MSKSYLIVFILFCIILSVSTLYGSDEEALPQYDLFSVHFPTDTEGWACGRWGIILHTNDSGASWSRQNSGTIKTLDGIFFIDSQNGWAVGSEGTIICTKDGGKSWAKQVSPVNYYLQDIVFVDPNNGWIVTERTHILHTDDGGNTWEVQFSDEDYILKSISFSDSLTGWAAGEYGYIYHTIDGGKTWNKQAGEFDFDLYGNITGGTYLFDILALSETSAVAVGIDGYVTHTDDGGESWMVVKGKFPNTHFFSVAMSPEGEIIIVGKGVIYGSKGGFEHFCRLYAEPIIEYGWLYSIAPFGQNGFAAVGREGWIYTGRSTSDILFKKINTYAKGEK